MPKSARIGICESCGRKTTDGQDFKGLFLCSFCLTKERKLRSELRLDRLHGRKYCDICGKQLKAKFKEGSFCADCSKLTDSEKEHALKIREYLKKGFHGKN